MPYQKIVFMLALLLVALLIMRALTRRDKDNASLINLEDLLIGDDGKISKAAAVMFGAFALSTWVIVYLTTSGKLTEGYFTAYLAAWVAPTVTKLVVNRGPA